MLLWILLVVLYLTALVLLGLTTLRKGHTALFWFGIILPVLWIVGALMSPTAEVAAAEAGAGLQQPRRRPRLVDVAPRLRARAAARRGRPGGRSRPVGTRRRV